VEEVKVLVVGFFNLSATVGKETLAYTPEFVGKVSERLLGRNAKFGLVGFSAWRWSRIIADGCS
jgi:hypothetical protein